MARYRQILLLLFLFFCCEASAEVVEVVIRWKPGFCSDSCLVLLERRLGENEQVDKVIFQASQSQAILRVKRDKRFSFRSIDATMRSVGVKLNEIFVTVRGSVKESGNTLSLVSLGDGTEFLLLSPIAIRPGEAAVEKNIESHMLQPAMESALLKAKSEERSVKIEGPLFEPERAPPLFLIIKNIAIEKQINKNEQEGKPPKLPLGR